MIQIIEDLYGSTVALLIGIGGSLFIPIALVALAIGIFAADKITIAKKIYILSFSAFFYFVWSIFFVFAYEYAPGETEYHVSGWRLTPPADAFLRANPALAALSRDQISEELMKSFKAPEYVWLGSDLTAIRAAGSVMMASVLLSVGLIAGSLIPRR